MKTQGTWIPTPACFACCGRTGESKQKGTWLCSLVELDGAVVSPDWAGCLGLAAAFLPLPSLLPWITALTLWALWPGRFTPPASFTLACQPIGLSGSPCEPPSACIEDLFASELGDSKALAHVCPSSRSRVMCPPPSPGSNKLPTTLLKRDRDGTNMKLPRTRDC